MAIVILNFKAYKQAIGDGALKLAQIAKEVSQQTGVRIIVAPQHTEISKTSLIIETIAQNIDPIDPGRGTGYLLADSVLQNGGIGSILNHSEHKMDFRELGVAVTKMREIGLKSFVCAKDTEEARQIAFLNPDFIAVEPPELIGTGKSVSTTQPEVVKNSVNAIQQVNKKVKILCGAGISNGLDAKKAKELGTEGVLLASAFVLAKDPKAVLLEIANGLK
ncbi:TPA: triose-phosphate isomerase [archaeon]|uniref:Triosephosphate isomerase n=1 Tax=Candidatus Naiadarchaeum limnaeum TaxID=2756139 RepID=A0A832V226_9ARCH|nr:triose-phosphate isomerase [Candidatus Naiadarchaeales archaeon SRR2090153.bin1042]HIK00673.1 triose-phosphate isomerase [Candidatus Naiadarchaeum limnaeum]